jgi:transcriptional regulator with XRE-family HTH domain
MPIAEVVFPLSPREGRFEVVTKGARQVETLAEYVRRAREEHEPPLSLVDVERESARHGWRIDESTVSKIENGHRQNPGADVIVGLHYGLRKPLLEIISVIAGKPLKETDAQDEQLLTLFHSLRDDEERELALKFLRTHARARGVKPAEVKPMKKWKRRTA